MSIYTTLYLFLLLAIVRAVPTAALNRSRYLLLVFSDNRTPEERANDAAQAQVQDALGHPAPAADPAHSAPATPATPATPAAPASATPAAPHAPTTAPVTAPATAPAAQGAPTTPSRERH